MTRIKVEGIIEELSTHIRGALEEAVLSAYPFQTVNRDDIYREFRSALARRCRTWEEVPDAFVERA
jgi:uncharacterized protein (DUF433 family)